MKPLEDFIVPTQAELFRGLKTMYAGNVSSCKGSYVLVHGEAPILLVAHLDTVHKEPVKHICKTKNGTVLMSPQGIGGDDRCGVYALNTVYEQSVVKPWLLFTCDEEVGGMGAEEFCKKHKAGKLPKALDELKAIIEIDRKGQNDAVYYDCDNAEFEKYITGKGFKADWGSFSDISYIAPELGAAAVNLSSGYYNAHTQHEYINRKHLNATVRRVAEIVADAAKPAFPKYEYVEATRFAGRYGGWGDWSGYRERYLDGAGTVKLLQLDDDAALKNVPKEIREEYAALLDFYDASELEALRAENGDRIIPMMFESDFGSWEDYSGLYGDELEYDEYEDDYRRVGK